MIIDGTHITRKEIRDLLLARDVHKETTRLLREVTAQRDQLQAELTSLCEFRDEVVGIMNNSSGVAGWHKNHTIATWDELLPNVPDDTLHLLSSPANAERLLRSTGK